MWALIPNPSTMGQTLSGDERARFSAWYAGVKHKTFNIREERLAYCMDDVKVLRQECCAFRNLFLKLVKVDPFRQAITISSICNKVFRTTFLKPDFVGIIPRGGYRMVNASLLRLLNRWRTLVGRVTILFLPVMGGK